MTRRTFLAAASSFTACPLFSTPAPSPAPLVRFGVFTDCHYADRAPTIFPDSKRYYRLAAQKVEECVASMNALKPDFLIELGDFKDMNGGESGTLKNLELIEAVFSKFNGPRHHVLGNHDCDAISKSQFLSRVSNSGFKSALPHYSFSLNGVEFIVLDANFNADLSHYDHGNYDWRVAVVPPPQLEWLRSVLEKGSSPAVVFCHQRLDTSDILAVRNAREVRAILEKSKRVAAVFTGHHHDGGFSRINGIPYYTIPGVIEGQTLADNAWIVASVNPDSSVSVQGFKKISATSPWNK